MADLGFEGIFQILAGIPADRLIRFRHKLSCSHHDQRSCHLLHVMILFQLGRADEARVQLHGLRDDVAASRLFQCYWGDAGARKTPPEPLADHAKVARTMAEIYSLLVDERLCEAPARDDAYRAAIQAFQASNISGTQLKGLLDDAADKCGLQFISTVPGRSFGAQLSARREPRRSSPVPIASSSPPDPPQPLRSTDTPVSFISSFKISDTSVGLATDSPRSTEVPLALLPTGRVAETGPMSLTNGCSTNPGEPSLRPSTGSCLLPDPTGTWPPTGSFPWPKHCTPTPAAAEPTPPPIRTPPLPELGPTASAGGAPRPGPSSPAPAQATSPGPLPASPSSPSDLASRSSAGRSSLVPPAAERPFYTFVVVHAAEDELVACRVKERLEALGVSNGATFSEDFLLPGGCQLDSLQNALDDSAFTLLLLTRNFKGRLCGYQRNTALMDSLQRFSKSNSVIPFVPKESSLGPEDMPLLLASLVPLNEKSAVFDKRVKKTFTATAIREKKATWEARRQIQDREQRREREREHLRMQQHLSALSIHPPAPAPAGDTSLQAPLGRARQAFPTSTMSLVQPGSDQALFPLMFSVGPPSTTPAPQLVIQNAQMIQIGDYNRMQVERSNATVGAADRAVAGGLVAEGGTSPRD